MGRPIMIVTGPSGAGKSRLIWQALQAAPDKIVRLRTTTTRPPRDAQSDEFYDLVSDDAFQFQLDMDGFAEHDEYNPANPYRYGTTRAEFDRVGPGQVGIKDMTEPGLKQLLDSGRYRIRHVRIQPLHHAIRSADRVLADEARAKLIPVPDYEIVNDHADAEGFDKALTVLMNLLLAFAADPD